MHPAPVEPARHRRADGPAPLAGEGTGGDLPEHALVEQPLVALGCAQERGAALGVGEQHGPALERLQDQRLEVAGVRGQGRLEQHVAPAAEAQAVELVLGELREPRQRDLPAGAHLDGDARGVQRRLQRGHALRQRRRVDVPPVVDVRGGHERPHAKLCGDARERHRGPEVGRPVVDARQGVTVQVDHGLV